MTVYRPIVCGIGLEIGAYDILVWWYSKTYIVVVLTLTRIIKSVVTGQAPVTLKLRNTPEKTHNEGGSCTRIYHN